MACLPLLILICYISSINCLPTGCTQLPNPTWITCSRSRLTSVPVGLPKDTTELDLGYNQISTLTNTTWNLPSLKILYLTNNHISTLINTTWNLPSLKTLYLGYNQISTLTNTTWNLPSLKILFLYNNRITSLNNVSWSGLVSLQKLYLHLNRITSLHNVNWSGLASLQELHLDYNRITSLHNVNWSGLASLQELSLTGNRITSLNNVNWSGLASLQKLYLSANEITSLNNVNWSGLASLQTLYLSANEITSLNNVNWSGLASLQTLFNRITSLNNVNWSGLVSLQTLDLGYNNITSLNDANWTGLTPLTKLYLGKNNISSFRDANWTGFTSLTYLDIEGNPAAKDCQSSICLIYSIGKANTTINGISHCNITFCEVNNGGWSNWTTVTWAGCSTTCGYGARQGYRSRTCTNPSPKYGGSECKGVNMKYQAGLCNIKECPINGNWSEWSDVTWTGCSTTCGNGSRQGHISRTCTNPSPKYGGSICEGLNMKNHTNSCYIRECPTVTPADNTWIIIVVAVITGFGGVLIVVLVCIRCNTNRGQYTTNRQDEGMYDEIDETEMRELERQDADRQSILTYEHPYFQPLGVDVVSYEQASTSREYAYQPIIANRENAHTEDVRGSYTDAMSRIPKSNTDRDVRQSYTDALSVLPEGDTARKRRNTY